MNDKDIKEAISRGYMQGKHCNWELKIPMAQAIQDVFADNPKENDPRQ